MSLSDFVRANRKLVIALACYLVLIVIALYSLLPARTSNDQFVLWFVLCFFAVLIIKTIIHAAQIKTQE
jgi:Ca2+/Na+ antiporter